MEQVIKEYLNINAPKYAEFKGYNEDFIKAVNDFTEGAEPTEQVLQFYDEAMDTVKKFLEGGNIPKFQEGGVNIGIPEWFLKYRKLPTLPGWTLEKDSSKAGKNLTSNQFHHKYGDLTGAWNTNQAYTANKDIITLDLNNAYKVRYANLSLQDFVNNYNKTAGEIRGRWLDRDDIVYNANDAQEHNLKHKALFASRNGATNNPWDLGYSESTESIQGSTTWMRNMDLYEKEFGELSDEEKKNRIHKIGDLGYVYKKANGDIDIVDDDTLKRLGLNIPVKPASPNIQTKSDLESGIPNVAHKPFNLSYKVSEMFPDFFELTKFFNSIRTNKRIRDLGLLHRPVTSEVVPEYSNIYGDLAALNQSYNEAANLLSKANRLGANTSDYRTASVINLQGYLQGEPLKALGRKLNNDRAMTTYESALSRVFKNNVEKQKNANENYASIVNNWNYGDDVRMAYENLKHLNYKNLLDYLETDFKQKDLNEKQFYASMLESQMEKAINNDPELLKYQKLYAEAKTQEEKDKAYNNFIEIKRRKSRELLPIYYLQLAKLKGIRYNPDDNPFMIYAKSGVKISDDGPVRTRSKDLERRRKSRKDARDSNDKKLDRLGRLMYLHAKGASSRK